MSAYMPDYKPSSAAMKNRFDGIKRDYSPEDVAKIRGSFQLEHTIAKKMSEKLWTQLQEAKKRGAHVAGLGCVTGGQAVSSLRAAFAVEEAGKNAKLKVFKSVYVSGWQVAADGNSAGNTFPDQSIYPANSMPQMVARINNALRRQDMIDTSEGKDGSRWMVPLIADAEAGFGGVLNCYELAKNLIESGAAAVHYEDQLASEKKCGHLGGKVLVPTKTMIKVLTAARLAADAAQVPTVIIARTDARAAALLTSDIDDRDKPFLDGTRTAEGFYGVKSGIEQAIARGLAYAPYADILWMETSTPSVEEFERFAKAIHAKFPGKMLAYNNSPSFAWKKNIAKEEDRKNFMDTIGKMGATYQFITLAGFHALNYSMFELASGFAQRGMAAYSQLQEEEFAAEKNGYTATKHQHEVGTSYFDAVASICSGGTASTLAMKGSTEAEQFNDKKKKAANGAAASPAAAKKAKK